MLLNSLSLDTYPLLIILTVVFLAALIKGFSGFGFSAFMIVILSNFFVPIEVLPINFFLEILSGLFLLSSSYKHIKWRYVVYILLGYTIFIPLGLMSISVISLVYATISISIIAIVISLLMLASQKKTIFKRTFKDYQVLLPVGAISGFLNGFSSMGGIISVLGFMAVNIKPKNIRSTVIMIALSGDIYAILISWNEGIINTSTTMIVVLAIPFLALGLWIGSKLFNKSEEATYKKFAISLLLLVSFAGLIRSVINFVN